MLDVEIEKKAMLSKSDFDKLKDLYDYKSITQTNYYFDDKSCNLHKNRIALRVREKQSSIKFTLKDKRSQKSNHHCIEVSSYISKEMLNEFLKTGIINSCDISDYLYDVNYEKLELITKFETKRLVKEFDDYKLFLDHTVFDNKEDYELEIESHSLEICTKVFEEYCSKYDLVETTNTKLYRALSN